MRMVGRSTLRKYGIAYAHGRGIVVAAMVGCILAVASIAMADTIVMKNGKEIQGIIVEEYRDRVTCTTASGETTIMKSDISQLTFANEETNLIKLAEQATDRHKYERAAQYYSWALKINPESKAARDGMLFLQLSLTEKMHSTLNADMKRMEEIDRLGGSIAIDPDTKEALAKAQDDLRKHFGLLLKSNGNMPQVYAVKPGSSADRAGIKKDDIVIAIWGRLTGYMSIKEVVNYFLERASREVRCTIERTITVPVSSGTGLFSGAKNLIGADLKMEVDGLTISKLQCDGAALEAGLRQRDQVVAINGNPTRYMPLKKAIDMIRNSPGSVKITVRRDAIVWKSDNE